MRMILAFLLICIIFPVNGQAFSISKYKAYSFVSIQETDSLGNYQLIGAGMLIEITDCFSETYLVTRPEFLHGRDTIYINPAHIEEFDSRGLVPLELKKNEKILWKSYANAHVNVAALDIFAMGGMLYAIDTAYTIPLSSLEPGRDAVFLEYVSGAGKSPGDALYPFARNAVVSYTPALDVFDPEGELHFADSVFYIDAHIASGSIGSPVFALRDDSTRVVSLIGMIMGPYQSPDGDQHLGVVAPVDAIIKVIDYFHGCDK